MIVGFGLKEFHRCNFLKFVFLLLLHSRLPDRLMAGLQILVLTVLVRIQLGQQKSILHGCFFHLIQLVLIPENKHHRQNQENKSHHMIPSKTFIFKK